MVAAMRDANIVYWYGQSEMPHDGGGLRALAWHDALTSLGYRTTIYPLTSVEDGLGRRSRLRQAKKAIIPMPFQRAIPSLPHADLNVITVPAAFTSASKALPKSTLIFDWMDLWSVNARTMASSSNSLRLGGYVQSQWWKWLETTLPDAAAGNAFAGHHDFLSLSRNSTAAAAWLPTPVDWPNMPPSTGTGSIRRVGFIGNMNYAPNLVSLRKFLDEYAGRMQLLGLELVVAGFGSEVVNSWGANVTVLGPVDDVSDFYSRVDAAVVPIDYGGGIKVKAVEALVYGVPVFGTDHVRDGFSGAFRQYVRSLDDLMTGEVVLRPNPTSSVVREAFSQLTFQNGVKDLLDRSRI